MNQSQAHDQELIRKAQNPREEITTLRADLARVTENYNTLLDAYVAGVNEAATETVSERCRRIGVQSCGFCEDAACGDNTNPTIDAMKADLARVNGERDEARKLVHNISDKFDVFDERLPIRTGETRQLFDTDEYRNLSDAITSAITSIDAAREVVKNE